MSRKTRPYLFYDTTASVCTTCLRRVEAKILVKGENVFLEKWCPQHGTERVLICDDAAYYRLCREVYVKAPEMPQRFATEMLYGCPYDCGLCPDHMQHSCLSIVEVTDHCNLECPICYADSGPRKERYRSLEQVFALLDTVVKSEGEADVVQISGGEPTLHPDIFAILDRARELPIKHLMLNTNGIRIAKDRAFVERLAQYRQRFEVYLQFDSLEAEALLVLRGADLRNVRAQALAHLNEFDISTTLVATVAKGVNDQQIGDMLRFAAQQQCVRGVTLQPVQAAGRVQGYARQNALTVSEVRRAVAQSGLFALEDVLPVPCNPDTLAMAYALKLGGQLQPLTRYVDAAALLSAGNTIVYEPQIKEKLFTAFATNHSPAGQANCLSELLCCLPNVAAPPDLSYRNVFRVLIVQFMDARNLDLRALKKSCVHIATDDGRMVPFEAYNLFYRDERRERLRELRSELRAPFAPQLIG